MAPGILYKYREDSELTALIIENQKIWLATPAQLNDPVECRTGVIPEDWKAKVIRENEEAQIMGVFGFPPQIPETIFSLNRRQTSRWFRALRELPHAGKVRHVRKLYREHGMRLSEPSKLFATLEQQLATIGIFSMSASNEIQPLWAHYAGGHTGLALGFAVSPDNALGDERHTFPVVYDDDKPTYSEGFLHKIELYASPTGGLESRASFSPDDPVFRATVRTKPKAWAYEEEWRFVHERAGLHNLPGRLVSVTFGVRTPPERKAHYAALLAKHGLEPELFEVGQTSAGGLTLKRARFA